MAYRSILEKIAYFNVNLRMKTTKTGKRAGIWERHGILTRYRITAANNRRERGRNDNTFR